MSHAVEVKNVTFTYPNGFTALRGLDFTIENGNGKFTLDKQYNFSCQCESGKIYLDDENIGDSYAGVYPEMITEEGAEVVLPNAVKGKITSGDLVIDTAE